MTESAHKAADLGLPADLVVEETLGAGSMGVVYKCLDKKTKQVMAVKVLRPNVANDSRAVQRFTREAETLINLKHEHIVGVRRTGLTTDGLPFMAMEFLPGMPLEKALELGGTAGFDEVIDILVQCASALGYAHKRGIVHRDLKPGNIIVNVDEQGRTTLKIVDFGICKFFAKEGADVRLTDTGQVLGTPLYMSPELVMGKAIDGRSDMYSLGCVVFEALTGRPPLVATDAYKLLTQHVTEKPPDLHSLRPDVPPALKRIVERMMEKSPDDRYQTMEQLLADLDTLRDKGKVPTRLTGGQKRALRLAIESLIFGAVGFAIAFAVMAFLSRH